MREKKRRKTATERENGLFGSSWVVKYLCIV
jgi:hypothetical protein